MPRLRLGFLLLLFIPALAHAQTVPQTVPVLMLSDIHFDPFHDPGKLPELRAEPIQRWPAILAGPASPDQATALQTLQTACNSRALDTAWPLLKDTLAAAHDALPHPLFVIVPGDLLAHDFPCRFRTLAPNARAEDLSAFAAKTVQFLSLELGLAFPHAPHYIALGNNDSGCADYRETPGSPFLEGSLRFLAGTAQTATADAAFTRSLSLSPNGDFSVALPAPMQRTRLIVLEDTFDARQFTTCAGVTDRTPERTQLDWLRTQLASARAAGEQVWVMAHIPPGVDVYTSFHRYLLHPADACTATPTPFLADTALADTLLDYAGTVRLALFGHTHMDEIRVLHRDTASGEGSSLPTPSTVPVKLVPSVTPFFGNHPAFLVAAVDPRTAVLKDWRTIISPSPDGSTPPWAEAYRFTTAYGLPDFSAASALQLADSFTADRTGQAPRSTAFRQHFYAGDLGLYALGLAQLWPAYACAVREDRPSTVHTCLCAALPPPTTKNDEL